MDQVELGRTGIRVSRAAFGCAAIGGHDYGIVDDAQSERAIRRALDAGIELFDVADVYGLGHAEEILGRALLGRRSQVVIATKVGMAFQEDGRVRRDLSAGWIRRAVEASLRRLGTEVIDLYQVHWPDPDVPLEESLGELSALRSEGKIRHIGVCNFPAELLERAASITRLETIQVSYNVADWQAAEDVRTIAQKHQLTLLAYNCLAQGMLTGKYDETSVFSGTDRRQRSGYFTGPKRDALLGAVRRMDSVCKRYGRTRAQLAVRWVLDSWPGSVAIVGMKSVAQVEEVSGTLGWMMDPVDVDLLTDRTCVERVST
jgi:aryl-alcohol dehydrogenase-like predicted oxidoreductase